MIEHAVLLERLRWPVPEVAPDGIRQERDLAMEAAQHPEQYPALLRQILTDPAVDDRWKQAALRAARSAVNLRTLEVVYAFAASAEAIPMKEAAVAALGRLSEKLRQDFHLPVPLDYLSLLEELRSHPGPGLRAAAHTALWMATHADFDDERRAAFVRRVLDDEDPGVFTSFFISLRGTNGIRGKRVEEELARLFSTLTDARKRAAIVAASADAAEEGLPALLGAALTDPEPEVRRAAIHAVGRLRDASALPTLQVLLNDEAQTDATTRRALLKGIAALGTPEAARTLGRYALGTGDRVLRDEALAHLQSAKGVQGDDALARMLIQRLETPDDLNRRESLLYAIGRTGTPTAADALVKAYAKTEDAELRETILHAALDVRQEAAYALLAGRVPEVQDRSLKTAILNHLAVGKRPELLPLLAKEYAASPSDADYRIELTDAAAVLGTPEAVAFLRQTLSRETDADVRTSIERSLEELDR